MRTALGAASVLAAFSVSAAGFHASLADPAWDGKVVPALEQCQKFGGQAPKSPRLKLDHVPAGTDRILLAFSDRDSEKMNHGGHGQVSYSIENSAHSVTIESIPGHSFDLPAGFELVEAQRSPNWDKAGAYMPPCSGGKKHYYYVTITALQGEQPLAKTVVEMGVY